MRNIVKLLGVFFTVMLFLSGVVYAEEFPTLPERGNSHYFIYSERARDNRTELVYYDINYEKEGDVLVLSDSLQLWDNRKLSNVRRWYLSNNQWVECENEKYTIGVEPGRIFETDIEILDLNSEMLEWEKINKQYPEPVTKRYWDGNNFIRFVTDGNLKIKVSSDGIGGDLYESHITGYIQDVYNIGNGFIVFTEPMWNNDKIQLNTMYTYDYKYDLIAQNDLNGNNSFIGRKNNDIYILNSNRNGDKYYKTSDGIEWTEVDKPEISDLKHEYDNSKVKFNGYNEYQININNEYYGINFEDDDVGHNIIYHFENKFGYYITTKNYGYKTIISNGDIMNVSRDKEYLSLDGVNGFLMPDADLNAMWATDEYFYIDADKNTYYRLPMQKLSGTVKVVCNGNVLAFTTLPTIENDRTLVPMRFLFEQMGADVDWDNATQTAIVKKQGDTISFSINDTEAKVNNTVKTMDVPARLINDKTMIPLRFLSEELGYSVQWDGETRTVTITD